MKFVTVLAFAATALALPADQPPSTDGICAKAVKTKDGWAFVNCPTFTFAPGSDCYATPEDLSKPYPDCCSKPVCP